MLGTWREVETIPDLAGLPRVYGGEISWMMRFFNRSLWSRLGVMVGKFFG